jgi:uncharacterized membrane protein
VLSAVAIYLICHDHFRPGALLATVLVTALVFAFARPVPGVGIVTPALLPPAVGGLPGVQPGTEHGEPQLVAGNQAGSGRVPDP